MKILFICTHNRCRSILAEAITNAYGHGVLKAESAGSEPAGEVHPMTLEMLLASGIAVDSLYSKSWDVMTDIEPDVVITVCDSAGRESCPVWLGHATKIHWGLPDPSALKGEKDMKYMAFRRIMNVLESRVKRVVNLVEKGSGLQEIEAGLRAIGEETVEI